MGESENSVIIPERDQAHEVKVKSGILVSSEFLDICILQYT